jgi:ankyrin repeat protein
MHIFTAINLGEGQYLAELLEKDPSLARQSAARGPLHEAARHKGARMVQLLVKAGADPNARAAWKRWTPLHFAANDGRTAAAAELLRAGADANVADADGQRPLDIAFDRHHLDLCDLLRRHGAKGRPTA